ncbi:hypothetical protein [Pandoraea sp. PE-S2T-3]|uniref:hypothetical protein n=1 Tax=Pandoraea sp. PE-S2T-3 TaxID=1986993 RepID=UPI001124F979|nr:hypothetical protein [Pandoraea sp. PE-S2T-3]
MAPHKILARDATRCLRVTTDGRPAISTTLFSGTTIAPARVRRRSQTPPESGPRPAHNRPASLHVTVNHSRQSGHVLTFDIPTETQLFTSYLRASRKALAAITFAVFAAFIATTPAHAADAAIRHHTHKASQPAKHAKSAKSAKPAKAKKTAKAAKAKSVKTARAKPSKMKAMHATTTQAKSHRKNQGKAAARQASAKSHTAAGKRASAKSRTPMKTASLRKHKVAAL